jgi:hypothetical protein
MGECATLRSQVTDTVALQRRLTVAENMGKLLETESNELRDKLSKASHKRALAEGSLTSVSVDYEHAMRQLTDLKAQIAAKQALEQVWARALRKRKATVVQMGIWRCCL